jgi:hypothetical protein
MPSLRIAKQHCCRQYHSKVVTKITFGTQSRPKPESCYRNVNLVLNLNTGLVSPQFHCRYDDFFETTRYSERDVITSANWKQLAGFVKYDGTPSLQDRMSSRDSSVVTVGTNTRFSNDAPIETPHDFPIATDDYDIAPDPEEIMQVPEGVIDQELPQEEVTTSAGTSSRGRVRKMSRAMQESVSQ